MYSNLYNYISIYWRNYIDKTNLDEVIRYLNNDSRLIIPSIDNIFKCFENIKPEEVKYVILGTEPFVNPDIASGLCYSVPENINPTSEIIKFNKLFNQTDFVHENMVKEGYLLLNLRLTTTNKTKGAHKGIGWENIIYKILSKLYNDFENITFISLDINSKTIFKSLSNNWFRTKSSNAERFRAKNDFARRSKEKYIDYEFNHELNIINL